MPETILDLGKKVKAKYPGQYDDLSDAEVGQRVKAKFPGAYDDFADVAAKPAGPAPAKITSYADIFSRFGSPNDQPETLGDKIKRGLRVTLNTEPTAQTGMGAEAALLGAATMPTKAFANIPTAIETAAAPTAKLVSGLGEQFAASPIAQGVKAIGKWAADKADLAQIYNRAAGVPAGRRGVEVSMSTGAVKTNPGQAAVRANEGKGALGQLKDAFFAKPTEGLRQRVNMEFNRANSAIKSQLGQVKDPLEFSIPDLKKAHEAVGAAGLSADEAGKVSASALDLHKLRSELGGRINWNPDFVTESNESLKDAWIDLSKKLDAAGGKSMPKLNKDFQEAYLYQRALKHQLELQEAGKKVAPSMARRTAGTLLKGSAVLGGLGTAGEVIKHLP